MTSIHNQAGFTLQELLIAMAIFFILSAIGVPSYINFARNGSRDNTTTELYSDMYYARSEAIKRRTNVSICRSGDVTVANPVCGGTAKTWSTGWLVFVDPDGDGNLSTGAGSTDVLLKVGSPANNKIQVMAGTTNDAFIQYLSDGSLNTNTAPAVFVVCDDRNSDGNIDANDAKYGQELDVSAMGRAEIINNSSTTPITTCAP